MQGIAQNHIPFATNPSSFRKVVKGPLRSPLRSALDNLAPLSLNVATKGIWKRIICFRTVMLTTRIYHLVFIYTNTLTDVAANRALAEIAKLANLPFDSHTILRWVDANYPNAYQSACHQPNSGKWLTTAADVEALL